MHRVHHFTSTRLAYDACFDDPHVREGDVLVIAREQIVGLASSDPIAVTTGHGYKTIRLPETRRPSAAGVRDVVLAALSDHAGTDNTSAPQTRGDGAKQREVTA